MVDLRGKFPTMLTFDVDGETLWLNRDPRNSERPVTMSLGRYGPQTGVPKILRLLDRYEIKATFFVPGWVAERYPDMLRAVDSAGHEVGHHGYLHEWLDRIDPADEEPILLKGIQAIEGLIGKRPIGYRAPAWEFTPQTLGLLAKHGFLYSSNMMDADGPYRHPPEASSPGLIELPVEWTLDDSSLYLYSLQIPGSKLTPNEQVLSLWCGEFDGLYADGGSCVLTCHPQLSGRSYRLAAVEQFIQHVLAKPNTTFVRCADAAEYFQSVL
jgi:peptidoglycan/xylan/chitin deacetylase (PgdA/CDA1 family)